MLKNSPKSQLLPQPSLITSNFKFLLKLWQAERGGCLNTQSWKVILTFEIFLLADIRGNKVSGLPERRAKILRGKGLGPRYAHISTDTRRSDKVTFYGKAETCLCKLGPWTLFGGDLKRRYGPYEAPGRVWSPRN